MTSPTVGLLEQFPVAPNGGKDIARPVFILTNRKLTAPTVFASASMTLSTRYDAKSDRMMYSFRQGQKTITFSEPAMPH